MPSIPGIPDSSVNLAPLPQSNPRVPTPVIAQNPYEELNQKVQKWRDMADSARVAQATNELENSRIALTSDYSKQMGANVLPQDGQTFTDRYVDAFKNAAAQAVQNLSPRQQAMFNQQSQAMGAQFHASVQAHETQQLFEHNLSSWSDKVDLAMQTAAQSYNDPGALGNAQANIDAAVHSIAQMKGLDPDGEKLLFQKAHDQFSTTVIGQFLDKKDITGARNYYNAHLSDMSADTAHKVNSALMEKEAIVQSAEVAQGLWNDKSLSYEQKMLKTQELFKDNPDGMKLAQEQLRTLWNAHMDTQRELSGTGWEQILGSKSPQAAFKNFKTTDQWAQMDGVTKAEFKRNFETWERRNDQGETRAERENSEIVFSHFVNDPDKLASMSQQAVYAQAHALGSHLHEVLAYQTSLKKDAAALQNAKYDRRIFNDVLEQNGYTIPGNQGYNKNDAQQQLYSTMDMDCRDAIARAQVSRKRLLTDDEVREIIQRQVGPVAVKRSWYQVGPQTRAAYKISSIADIDAPEATKQTAQNILREQGKDPNNVHNVLTTLRMLDTPGFLDHLNGGPSAQ